MRGGSRRIARADKWTIVNKMLLSNCLLRFVESLPDFCFSFFFVISARACRVAPCLETRFLACTISQPSRLLLCLSCSVPVLSLFCPCSALFCPCSVPILSLFCPCLSVPVLSLFCPSPVRPCSSLFVLFLLKREAALKGISWLQIFPIDFCSLFSHRSLPLSLFSWFVLACF